MQYAGDRHRIAQQAREMPLGAQGVDAVIPARVEQHLPALEIDGMLDILRPGQVELRHFAATAQVVLVFVHLPQPACVDVAVRGVRVPGCLGTVRRVATDRARVCKRAYAVDWTLALAADALTECTQGGYGRLGKWMEERLKRATVGRSRLLLAE